MPPHGCPGTRDAQRCGGEGTARDGLGSSCRRPELVSPTCGRGAGARGCAQHAWEAAPQDPPLCPRPQSPPPLPAAPPAPHLPPRLPGACAAQPLAGGTGLGPGRSWLRTEAGGPAPLSSPLGGNPEIPGARLPCGSPAAPQHDPASRGQRRLAGQTPGPPPALPWPSAVPVQGHSTEEPLGGGSGRDGSRAGRPSAGRGGGEALWALWAARGPLPPPPGMVSPAVHAGQVERGPGKPAALRG